MVGAIFSWRRECVGTLNTRLIALLLILKLVLWFADLFASGAPLSEIFRAIRTAIARPKAPTSDWAGTQADGSVSGAAGYESGGQEFESLRARQRSNNDQNNLSAGKGAMQNKIICMASAWPRAPRSAQALRLATARLRWAFCC